LLLQFRNSKRIIYARFKKNPAGFKALAGYPYYFIGSKLIAVPPPGAKFNLIFDLLVTVIVLIL
jgi:hypothetical protein